MIYNLDDIIQYPAMGLFSNYETHFCHAQSPSPSVTPQWTNPDIGMQLSATLLTLGNLTLLMSSC